MEPMTTTWRASLWARWLGWTLVFGLVVATSWVANFVVRSALPSVAVAVFVLPSYVAAFLIGMRFRSWWWLAGPAVVVMVLFVAVGLTTGGLAAFLADSQLLGASSRMSVFIYALLSLVGGGLLFAIPALLGVWWGKHHAGTTAGSTGSSLDGAASP
jgi:hypothetical protein